jgi:hypothetical protein
MGRSDGRDSRALEIGLAIGQQVAETAQLPAPRTLRRPLNRFTLSRPKKDFCGRLEHSPAAKVQPPEK